MIRLCTACHPARPRGTLWYALDFSFIRDFETHFIIPPLPTFCLGSNLWRLRPQFFLFSYAMRLLRHSIKGVRTWCLAFVLWMGGLDSIRANRYPIDANDLKQSRNGSGYLRMHYFGTHNCLYRLGSMTLDLETSFQSSFGTFSFEILSNALHSRWFEHCLSRQFVNSSLKMHFMHMQSLPRILNCKRSIHNIIVCFLCF